MSGTGMIGFALAATREAVFDERNDRLMLVRFESLVRDPKATLQAIYDFVEEPAFEHDPNHIEEDFDALMFDQRIGAPGLHSVGSKVRAPVSRACLPPDLFAKHEADAFWERPGELPKTVRLV